MNNSLQLPASYAEIFTKKVLEELGNLSYDKSTYQVYDMEVFLAKVSLEQVTAAKKKACKDLEDKVPGSARLYREFKDLERQAKSILQIKSSKDGKDYDPDDVMLYSLPPLVPALKDAIKKTSESRWVFVKIKGYLFSPAYVSNISYETPHRGAPYVSVSLAAVGGEDASIRSRDIYIYHYDLFSNKARTVKAEDEGEDDDGKTRVRTVKKEKSSDGRSLRQITELMGIYLSNESLLKEYSEANTARVLLANTTGKQFTPVDDAVEGISISEERRSWWRDGDRIRLTVDGVPSKLISDDTDTEDYNDGFADATNFQLNKETELVTGDYWDDESPTLPTIPVVRMFNLQHDNHVFVSANTVKPYAYDDSIWGKLVLPQADMDFVQMLLTSTAINVNDIVAGKAKGTIVVCSGAPGLGKTLTAEAASEAFQRPLYSVQCSQLGVEPKELEKRLLLVLTRASRWLAILLLDESDVYVRRRETDLQQNAIVGVFLRVLEYYRGVMFMTTNLGDDIDDAILSRATAHLHYKLPDTDLLLRLWQVLSKQLSVSLSEDDISTLVKHFGSQPGRSIRNLIKLTKYLAVSKKVKPSAAMVIAVSAYLNTTTE